MTDKEEFKEVLKKMEEREEFLKTSDQVRETTYDLFKVFLGVSDVRDLTTDSFVVKFGDEEWKIKISKA
jgi:hypothetical protein